MVIDIEMNGSVPKTAWTDFKESSIADTESEGRP